jgi:hypothetical protein
VGQPGEIAKDLDVRRLETDRRPFGDAALRERPAGAFEQHVSTDQPGDATLAREPLDPERLLRIVRTVRRERRSSEQMPEGPLLIEGHAAELIVDRPRRAATTHTEDREHPALDRDVAPRGLDDAEDPVLVPPVEEDGRRDPLARLLLDPNPATGGEDRGSIDGKGRSAGEELDLDAKGLHAARRAGGEGEDDEQDGQDEAHARPPFGSHAGGRARDRDRVCAAKN